MRTAHSFLYPLGIAAALALAAGCNQPKDRTGEAAVGPAPEETATSSPTSTAGAPASPPPFTTPPVLAGTPDVASLVARVKPSVVNITSIHERRVPAMLEFPFGPSGSRGGDRVMRQTALGSGFIVDGDGHVVTNAHVVDGADARAGPPRRRPRVRRQGRRARRAPRRRGAQAEGGARTCPRRRSASSEALRVGEYVVAIGNPFGLGNTVTMGIVSAKGRAIGAGPYDDFIQTDASINPGNSGGPLFNLRGQVVGINTAINPNGKGIGFAIPIDAMKDVLPQLLATRPRRARPPRRRSSSRSMRPWPRRSARSRRRARWSARSSREARRRRRAFDRATSSSRSTARRSRTPRSCRASSRATRRARR